VRGAQHAFANKTRLAALVEAHGILYVPEIRLAPTAAIRALQKTADRKDSQSKVSRSKLADEFVGAYRDEILAPLDYDRYAVELLIGAIGHAPALLCVERLPSSCHRSLAAEWLSTKIGAQVVDLTP
jgi:uncharacterized protein (DUF488 family)